jgi:phage terminase large subunit
MARNEREAQAFAYWLQNPVEAVKDWFQVVPTDYQGDMLTGLFTHMDREAVKSAHGVGKTTTLAWAGWIFLNCYEDSRVVATAPTFSQLHDALWPEYEKWRNKMPEELSSQWKLSGNHIRHKGNPMQWFAVARTSNKPQNLQGFHGAHILIEADECSGIAPDVFEVIEGTLSEAGEDGKIAKLLAAGNPNFTAGEFYDMFTKNRSLYHRITVSGDPHFIASLGTNPKTDAPYTQGDDHKDHGKVYFSKRVTIKYRDTMAKKYGAESGVYDVRVRGVFPKQEDRAVIPLEWAERAQGKAPMDQSMFDKVADGVTLVLDVARFGGDETVLGQFRRGIPCMPLRTWPKTSTERCVHILLDAKAYWDSLGVPVVRIVVDEPGVGGGVIDSGRAAGLVITPYNGGQGMVKGVDPDDDCRMFPNKRSRDYWIVRRKLELNELPLPDDDVLIAQLASVHYDYNEKERIQVESKKKMRERLGEEASPDRADVIVMGCAPWYSMGTQNNVIDSQMVLFGADRELWQQMALDIN